MANTTQPTHREVKSKLNLSKLCKVALYVICITISLVQLTLLIMAEVTSTKLYTELQRVETVGQELPLVASVCVRPSHDQEELVRAGYRDYNAFYMGIGTNQSMVGWAGFGRD